MLEMTNISTKAIAGNDQLFIDLQIWTTHERQSHKSIACRKLIDGFDILDLSSLPSHSFENIMRVLANLSQYKIIFSDGYYDLTARMGSISWVCFGFVCGQFSIVD